MAAGQRARVRGGGALTASLTDPPALNELCTRITRKQLLAASALNALVLREAGVGFGDRVCFLLPHCIEQMVWVQACKRVGAICTCLPESISVASLAGRLFDTAASLCITSSAKSAIESGGSSSHKA